MRYRLRGFVQITLLRLRLRATYVLGVVGLVLALVLALPWDETVPLLVFSVASTVLGVLAVVLDTRRLWEEGRRNVLTVADVGADIDSMTLGDACHDYERDEFRGQRFAFDERIDEHLAARDVPLRMVTETFALPGWIKEHEPVILATKHRSGVAIFNSRLARLASDLSHEELVAGEPAVVQPSDYFAGECTNEMVGRRLLRKDERGRTRPVFSGLELLGSAGIFSDIGRSSCANLIGISTLAVTTDPAVVVVTQSGRSAQSPQQLAPSGSGSADPSDYAGARTLQDFVARAMSRELIEECGLQAGASPAARTLVLGFARVLTRGGKPEFFGVSTIDADIEQLRVSRRERTYVSAIDPSHVKLRGPDDLVAALAAFRAEAEGSFSLSLHLNLVVLARFATRHWDELDAFLGGHAPGHDR